MSEWIIDEGGDLKLQPVIAYQLAPRDGGIAVRVESLTPGLVSTQYVLKAARAVELGEEMARLGREALARQKS